jgi:hydrogenase-4 component H
MSVLSKFEETIICLKAGRVTLPYPAQARPLPENFRGRPIFNAAKCVGCAGCANNCPAREILVYDVCQEIRILQYLGRRCTYCGRCADVCPEKAITMSLEFENATANISDLGQKLDLFMSTCQRCGRCFKGVSRARRTQDEGLSLGRHTERALDLSRDKFS